MAPSAEDIRSVENRVADLQRELNSLQTALNAAERVAEASEAAKDRFRRVSQSAVAFATLLLIFMSLTRRRRKRQS